MGQFQQQLSSSRVLQSQSEIQSDLSTSHSLRVKMCEICHCTLEVRQTFKLHSSLTIIFLF